MLYNEIAASHANKFALELIVQPSTIVAASNALPDKKDFLTPIASFVLWCLWKIYNRLENSFNITKIMLTLM